MRKLLLISAMSCIWSFPALAQEDDDMYFTPSKEAKAQYEKAQAEALARYEKAHETYYCGSNMTVDEYNRMGNYQRSFPEGFTDGSRSVIKSDSTSNDVFDFQSGSISYPDSAETDSMMRALRNSEDYKYSRRMARFDGGRPVNVYVVNNYDPWYNDPWYWDSWYGPYWRNRWYWHSWYGPGWAYYDPWYYGPGWYRPRGWYRPVVIVRRDRYANGAVFRNNSSRLRSSSYDSYGGARFSKSSSRSNFSSSDFGSSRGGGASYSGGGGHFGGGGGFSGGGGGAHFGGGHR